MGAVAVGPGNVEAASMRLMAGLESIEEDNIYDPCPSDAGSSYDKHFQEHDEMDNTGSSASGTNRETSVTDSDSSVVTHMLNTHQRQAVDRIMTKLSPLVFERFGVRSRPAAASSPNGAASGLSEGQQGQRGEEQPRGGGANGNAGGRSKKRKSSAVGDENEERGLQAGNTSLRRFACPYFKHNPTGHEVARSCAGPGWETIHRVKEHIYRTHGQPRHCLRCGETFSIQRELAAHQRSSQTCELRLFDPLAGFTPEQELALKRKRRAACSEEEKWRHVFKISFPDVAEADIPSPYYENDSWEGLDRYDRYNELELPRAIRRRLEQAATAFSGPLENHLRSQLDRIIREALSETSAQYRNSQNPSETSFASPGVITNNAVTASTLENSGSQNPSHGTTEELNAPKHGLERTSGNYDPGPTAPSGYMDPFPYYTALGTSQRQQNPEHPPFWADFSSMQELFDILELPPAVEHGGEAGWHPTENSLNETEESLDL
ncbi:hypothetical protein V8F06_013501 [Rhypophila decipiens]